MATPGFLSKRVRKKSQTGLTTDRYEFLGLDQAEPDLGDPLVGLSSVGANPAPISGSKYVLVAAGGNTGKRYWVDTSTLSSTGLIPGSFTVFNNNIQVGAANSFNKFNFVGTGVTVDLVSSDINLQTGIATVRITVTDLVGPGNVNSIPYKASSGILAGASDFVYSTTNIGIGSTQPTVKLDVIGDVKVLGTIIATDFNTTSDVNLKTNIHQIENSLSKVIQIRGVTFDWKENNRSSAGVIAQEVENVLPEFVNGEETKTVNYNGITGALIESIKELKAENDIMKQRLDEVYKKVFG